MITTKDQHHAQKRAKMSFIRKYTRKGRTYLAEVENQRIVGSVKQKFIRYIGVDAESKRSAFPSCNEELSLDGVKVHGSILALDSVAKLLNLREILGEYAEPILSLAYCHCHDYKGVKDMTRWLSSTSIYHVFDNKEITEKQLHDAISAIEKMDVMSMQKSIFEKLKALSGDSCTGIVYDVTNTYLRGSLSTLAQKGKDKEGVRGRRIIQVGLGMTEEMRLPIFHQIHSGNTSDSKMFTEGIQLLRRFGMKRGTIVYDRGMHAKSSILDLANIHWKVIGGVPFSKGIKDIISKMDLIKLETFANRVEQGLSVFYVKTIPHKIGDVKGRLAILLDPQKRHDLRQNRLHQLTQILEKNEKIPDKFKKFFNSNKNINTHAVKREERLDGLSAIFTTGRISSRELVKTYFDKDLIEHAFKTLKSVLAVHPLRHWLDGKITGHVFICYLSLVLLTTFRILMQKTQLQSLESVTAERALKELQAIYMIEYRMKSKGDHVAKTLQKPFYKVITLSNLQKKIFHALCPNIDL